MKLTKQIKEKIDKYFDQIDAKDLVKIALIKYNFKELILVENENFDTIQSSFYQANSDSEGYAVSGCAGLMDLSLAA